MTGCELLLEGFAWDSFSRSSSRPVTCTPASGLANAPSHINSYRYSNDKNFFILGLFSHHNCVSEIRKSPYSEFRLVKY